MTQGDSNPRYVAVYTLSRRAPSATRTLHTIIMRADNNGEGGIMSLLALNLRTTRIAEDKKIFLIALGFIGASLFFGDGIITPAISVLSAIEGLSIATPIFNQWLVPLSIGILAGLFIVQRHGTGTMGKFLAR